MALPDRASNVTNGTKILPRVLIIGAGSRGTGYARAIRDSGAGVVAAIAEPIAYKRRLLGSKYIWPDQDHPGPDQEFEDWKAFVSWETARRTKTKTSGQLAISEHAITAVFVCVLDEQHAQVVTALAPLGLHIMCEKPLATSLDDCLSIYSSLLGPGRKQQQIFGIGHVLRYSPHNMLLRKLVRGEMVVGDILSIDHTEPVGWWHFSHSYVRGNWRRESTTAPSLLTKSCHDIDWLLWMLCTEPPASTSTSSSSRGPHLPSHLTSTGSVKNFRRFRKPAAAGKATNCLSCPIRETCMYSAPKIYYDRQLARGNTQWPVYIVNPEIETCLETKGPDAAKDMLMATLAEDYDASTPDSEVAKRSWYGRCVWESDNDVCDDQYVTMTWDDDENKTALKNGHHAKTATFHMVANTEKQCERRGYIYGTTGEISYDGSTIDVYDFSTGTHKIHTPPRRGGGHGGGDDGLVEHFLQAVSAVEHQRMGVGDAQWAFLGCTLEEIVRSHAVVFAAEVARRERKVVEWKSWWEENVEDKIGIGKDIQDGPLV